MSIQTRDTQALIEFDDEKVKIIKNMLTKDLSDNEFQLFLMTCKHLGLDPLLRQIYAIKRGDKMTIQTGIDGYRIIAERSGKYMPGREATFTYSNNKLFSATAYVKKYGPDHQWHEVASTAILNEYNPNQGQWKSMPHVMLAKCAETAALRKAFPKEMGGVYTDEEMEQANTVTIAAQPIAQEPALIAPESLISQDQAKALDEMIGDDKEYRNKILDFYEGHYKRDINSFAELPSSLFEFLTMKIKEHNEERLKKEMETVELKPQTINPQGK